MGKLDEISEAIGGLRAEVKGLGRSLDQDRHLANERHAENSDKLGSINDRCGALEKTVQPIAAKISEWTPIIDSVKITHWKFIGALGALAIVGGFLIYLIERFGLWLLSKIFHIALFVAVLSVTASAHDHWISSGRYLDPVTGQSCCNEDDCKPIPADSLSSIVRNSDGSITIDGLTFLKGQQHKSEDGLWYRCLNRCVFAPVEG